MKKIYEKELSKYSEERLHMYDSAESDASKLRIVDISEVSYLPLYDKKGNYIKAINPHYISNITAYLINIIKSNKDSAFMSPYLEKKIIWSLAASTAFTNGVRIAFSPIFADAMYNCGSQYLKDNYTKITTANADAANWDIEKDKNMAKGLYIRFVITHEIYHMIYLHVRRAILHLSDPSDKQLLYIANVAQDLEINRDIVARWPEFETVVVKGGFLWFKDPKFINAETGQPFNFESWEPIYDYLLNHRDQLPPNDEDKNPEASDPKEEELEHPVGFEEGWRKAFEKIKNNQLDFNNINI